MLLSQEINLFIPAITFISVHVGPGLSLAQLWVSPQGWGTCRDHPTALHSPPSTCTRIMATCLGYTTKTFPSPFVRVN